MADDMEIERMLEEKMHENEQIINQQNGDKKEKDKKHKKHKHHKHHKSHKNDKKHERKRSHSSKRSRSPVNDRNRRSRTPPTLPSGKRRDVNSELHQLAQTLSQHRRSKDRSTSKSNRREKSPELTPEERDLRTVFCKTNFFLQTGQINGALIFFLNNKR